MRIEALGINDSIAPGKGGMSLLLDETIALDAGAITDTLSLERQKLIEYVVLSHAHFDHVKTLPFLADGLAMTYGVHADHPTTVMAPANVLTDLKKHVFNNVIWPDFTVIPPDNPVMAYQEVGESFELGNYQFRMIPLTHPIATYAIHIEGPAASVLYITDTGPTQMLWRYVNSLERPVDAMFIDVAFPNKLRELALVSGHLTPALLDDELKKITVKVPLIYPIHMKSPYITQISNELASVLEPDSYYILQPMEIVEW
ncbi:3',5'-cyclic-nucleotide phosphodiesterase [Desulfurispira natronophila]|uniref:cAMP phosphodiesterase n=1 Tax=Desulfurispira natronophila TaxID=682562 RepID=A0A7W7Y5J5_9BACT|nr:3',5'-cyclic-nucleotide phosphodiesterase [Desulfurispira natronophila]MBB5022444.1 cAMP phosphodiesterase [Desulfurispira natronophila]